MLYCAFNNLRDELRLILGRFSHDHVLDIYFHKSPSLQQYSSAFGIYCMVT